MNWIFSYGTLSHPEYIQLLLKRLPVFTDGILKDYELFVHPENHYLFVKPSVGKSISGKLFKITNDELKLIDRWEDVPLYEREILEIETKNGKIKAIVYTQHETQGLPFQNKFLRKHAEIMKDLLDFLEWEENRNSES